MVGYPCDHIRAGFPDKLTCMIWYDTCTVHVVPDDLQMLGYRTSLDVAPGHFQQLRVDCSLWLVSKQQQEEIYRRGKCTDFTYGLFCQLYLNWHLSCDSQVMFIRNSSFLFNWCYSADLNINTQLSLLVSFIDSLLAHRSFITVLCAGFGGFRFACSLSFANCWRLISP